MRYVAFCASEEVLNVVLVLLFQIAEFGDVAVNICPLNGAVDDATSIIVVNDLSEFEAILFVESLIVLFVNACIFVWHNFGRRAIRQSTKYNKSHWK